MNVTLGDMASGARFSECRTWRYALWRRLPAGSLLQQAGRGRCMFLMLNPSKADHLRSDNTVTRCQNYATAWGYDFLDVGNLFALRSTDPGGLYTHPDPVGPDNDAILLANAREAQLVVCAWGGTHGHHLERAQRVATMLRSAGVKLHALRLCAGRHARPPSLPSQEPGTATMGMTPDHYTLATMALRVVGAALLVWATWDAERGAWAVFGAALTHAIVEQST